MHGDFTRDTFDPARQFTRVLHQQGRLVLDADANEQSAIALDALRRLGADLIGWHGGVGVGKDASAILIGPLATTVGADKKVGVTGGSYYVDGIRVTRMKSETEQLMSWNDEAAAGGKIRFVFLDVWERHVGPWERLAPEQPTLLDSALGGLDTTTRVQLRSDIGVLFFNADSIKNAADQNELREFKYKKTQPKPDKPSETEVVERKFDLRPLDASIDNLPRLAAWTRNARDPHGPETPDATVGVHDCDGIARDGFTGPENQLYRVEVHAGGTLGEEPNGPFVTIKWSRDNGSVVYPYKDFGIAGETCTLTLAASWRDESRALAKDQWVEVMAASEDRGTLIPVQTVEQTPSGRKITLSTKALSPEGKASLAALAIARPNLGLLRRWDHATVEANDPNDKRPAMDDGGIVVSFAQKDDDKKLVFSKQLLLEDGLLVRLAIPLENAEFRAGDSWLIPARASLGDVLWNVDDQGKAAWQPARYTEHHYAPLAIIADNGDVTDLRKTIKPLTAT